MGVRLLNIGFDNVIVIERIVALVTPSSSPIKRLKEIAKKNGKLIDATSGRRTRSVIITDTNHVILSALQPETITQRFNNSDHKK
jgi:extracellular matrix regulatory protein A